MKMQDQCAHPRPKRRAWLKSFRCRRRYVLAATGADTAVTVDPGDEWTDRWQVDVVVGVDLGLVGRAERVGAMRAGGECSLDGLVRMLGQCAGHPGAAGARRFLGGIGQVRLLALRGRQAGVVRRFRRACELGLQFRDARGQQTDLFGLRLDLRMLRQDQGDQLITGEGKQACVVHASVIDSAMTVSRGILLGVSKYQATIFSKEEDGARRDRREAKYYGVARGRMIRRATRHYFASLRSLRSPSSSVLRPFLLAYSEQQNARSSPPINRTATAAKTPPANPALTFSHYPSLPQTGARPTHAPGLR